MRKLVVSTYVSLDGVVQDPAWTMPYWSEELANYAGALTSETDTLLLGRVTYEGFAAAWPSISGEGSGADFMNSVKKVVVTNTLQEATWQNSHILKGDLATEVQALKDQEGKNILIYGSGDLVDSLTQLGLIDEYHYWVHPVVVGAGKRNFATIEEQANLRLLNTKTLDTGVIVLVYAPDKTS